ncbi:hypothetical protein ACWDKQ_28990 [Saccharopolyspora sp. NPDC000995]
MTASLGIAPPSVAPPLAPEILIAGVRLGESPALPLLLSAALGDDSAHVADAPDGLLMALESWAGNAPPPAVVHGLDRFGRGGMCGRPVGVIAVGHDLVQTARNLVWARRTVRGLGGYVVGSGICVDAADVGSGELDDVTLSVSLALLGQRVRALARIRLALRVS